MSLKSTFISILTVGAGVVVFSTAGFSQDDKTTTTTTTPEKIERPNKGERKLGREGFEGRHGKHGRMGGDHGILRGINLTDAQKLQLKAIREGSRPDAATMAELKAIHEARKSRTAITPEQQERLKALHEQFRAKTKAAHEQMLNILTPEQKSQIEQNKSEMKQRMLERRQQRELRTKDPAAAICTNSLTRMILRSLLVTAAS